jgi:methylenetetrahydrofolate reductase (NADPH)
MKPDSKLANKISSQDFIITAEYMPQVGDSASSIEKCAGFFKDKVTAVNVSDNHYGIATSSLAASVVLGKVGVEPIYQITTRDRNRIAIQSDLLGAALLGIKNVLCISGYHQTLIGCSDSANVFDLDSTQLLAIVKKMNEEGSLLDGTKIDGAFSMLVGAVANPYMTPLELNIIRLSKKVAAGASFIQTQAVFDIEEFQRWLSAAQQAGITKKAAIIAGVLPLIGAAEAKRLIDAHTELNIPNQIIEQLAAAGGPEDQKKKGIAISAEIIKKLRGMNGLRGVHILSGGKESVVPELLAAINK